jgi:serine/threonine-protein kinase
MELVDGQPLSAAVRSRPMPAAAVIGLLTQAADALGAAHALGLVHRDVKPGNLLLSSNGVLKITDFGIAHAIGSAVVTDDGKVAGTARYMSPEQATGGPVAASSDVYSLAVVGYQLLAGRTPFDGAPAAVALAHVRALPPPLPARTPADLRALIEQSLDKDPAKRPANGDVMAAELRGLTDAPPMVAAPSDHAAVIERAPLADEAAATVLDATQVWSTQPSPVSTPPGPTAMLVDASRSRRRSRRLALAVGAVCVVALGVLGARADSGSGPTGQIPAPSTTVAPDEPAPSTATPTTTPAVISTTTVAPTPVDAGPPAPGKHDGNGTGNDKGKGKKKG